MVWSNCSPSLRFRNVPLAVVVGLAIMVQLADAQAPVKSSSPAPASQKAASPRKAPAIVPCVAKPSAGAPPAKPTAEQRKIFSLLDDKNLAEAKALVEADPQVLN